MSKFKGGNVMAKLEDTISRFFGGNDGIFGNRLLIIVVLVFLVLCTDILDNFFEKWKLVDLGNINNSITI